MLCWIDYARARIEPPLSRRACPAVAFCFALILLANSAHSGEHAAAVRTAENAAPFSETWDTMVQRAAEHPRADPWTAHSNPRRRTAKTAPDAASRSASPQSAATYGAASRSPQIQGAGFAGISLSDEISSGFGTYIPPDTNGAIGINHFVELINGSVTLYTKPSTGAGSKISRTDIDVFFSVVDSGVSYPRIGTFDPRIMFDRRSGHWFASALEFGVASSPDDKQNNIILCVSRTSDPSKVWDKYLIPVAIPDNGAVGYFNDFDTLGVDDNGVYFGMSVFPSDGSASFAQIAATLKAPLVNATPSRGPVFVFSNITDMYSSPQPAHNQDAAASSDPAWFVASSASVSANFHGRKLTWSAGVPTIDASATVLTTPSYSTPAPAPALGSTTNVDTGDDRMQAAVIRNGHLWTCRCVGVNSSGTASSADRTACEWFDISVPAFTVNQRGRVFDATANARCYYCPSIMVSGQGHAAMGFSGSNASERIGAYACGHLVTDTLGTMQSVSQLQAGSGAYTRNDTGGANRWGDFSYTSLDPDNDMTMWTIQEYATSTTNIWGTWISQLKAPAPTLVSVSPATPSGIQGQSGISLTLGGTGIFDPGPGYRNRLSASLSGGNIFNVVVTYTNSTTVTLTFDIGVSAATTARDIVLTNPDGQSATLSGAFKVNAGPANLTLGNRVWNDANGNGILDGGETGIDGVTVNLCEDSSNNNVYDIAADSFIATTTTSGGGNYSFGGLNPGKYIVLIPGANFKTGNPLHVLHSSSGNGVPAPDPDNGVDNDDNGDVIPGVGVASQAISLSANNFTLDFGFAPQTLAIDGVTANAGSVQKYAKLELTVALNNIAGTQYYDWDPAQGGVNLSATFTSPTSVNWTVYGFFDGSAWKIRFAPNQTGTWTYTVSAQDATGTVAWSGPGNLFTCAPSTYPGWLRINGQYLQFSEGQNFFGIGHNTGYQSDVEYPPLASMAAKGENVLSFWLAMPWAQPSFTSTSEPYWEKRSPIENSEMGLGNYCQPACAYIDGVVDRAEGNGIYLLPSIWAHDQLTDSTLGPSGWPSSWNNNPYKTLSSAVDFYKQGTEQWRLQQNFYRYLIARWGYSRAIAGWVGVVEINGTSGYGSTSATFPANVSQTDSWCTAVRQYFADHDPFHVNASGQYPFLVSKTDGGETWTIALNMRAVDSYNSQSDGIAVANTIATQTTTLRNTGKPVLVTEFGGVLPSASQPQHMHNGIWAGAASGGCMTPLLWGDDYLYANFFPMVTPVMQDHYQILSQFMRGVSYLGDPAQTAISSSSGITLAGTNSAQFRAWGIRTADSGIVWVQRFTNPNNNFTNQTVKINIGLTNGQYAVEWYDVWNSGSIPIKTELLTVSSGTFTTASLSLARPDVAMKFVRAAVWQGDDTTDHTNWNVAANWSTNAVPGPGNYAIIPTSPSGGAHFPLISAAPPSAIDRLQIQSGATLTINSGLTLQLLGAAGEPIVNGTGTVNGAGTLEIAPSADADGVLFANSMTIGALRLNAAFGARKFSLSSGVMIAASSAVVASGTLVVDGTLATTSNTINAGTILQGIGTAGTIFANGTVNPGAGIGTLTGTRADFSGGGALQITAANNSQTLAASGNKLVLTGATPLTLGGTSALNLTLNIQSGVYSTAKDTVLIDCTGGTFSGTFSSVTSNHGWPITGISIVYTASQVILRLSGNVTPVTLASFTGRSEGGGVLLSWECASEFQNAGFNLWRRPEASALDAPWTRVNASLIPGRLTSPTAKTYRLFDWPEPGRYAYQLETLSLDGVRERVAMGEAIDVKAGDGADDVSLETVAAAIDSAWIEAASRRGDELAKRIAENGAAPNTAITRSGTSPLRATSPYKDAIRAAATRAASARANGIPDEFVKIVAAGSGVLLVPQSLLPAGYDSSRVAIERGGVAVQALGAVPEGVLIFAPGYSDEYTDRDAFFLRQTSSAIDGPPPAAQNLFDPDVMAANSVSATGGVEFHDVYFDWSLRPFTYPPWFSDQYLSDASTRSFTLDAPGANGASGTLSVDLWSLTGSPALSPDHRLQAFVNGTFVGESQWSGGDQALTLSFAIPDGVLTSAANRIDLRTPDLLYGQISLLHALKFDYTRTLNSPAGVTFENSGAEQLCEIDGLPSDALWIVASAEGVAKLVPFQTQANGDAFVARFMAPAGARCDVVPRGSELRPQSVALRAFKPLPQNIRYLAVGPKQFADEIAPLLVARSGEGLAAAFVDQEELFDRFGFGRYSPEAIRSAVRELRPNYLLLVGRTTFDYRNFQAPDVDPLCPSFVVATSYLSRTLSDPAFGDLGEGFPQISVGRLPVTTADELRIAVARTLAYAGLPASGQRALMATDRADPAAGDFPAEGEATIQSAPEIAWTRAFLGVATNDAASVTERFRSAASGGADILVYTGHGNSHLLGLETPRILDESSVQAWTGNSVFIQATCNGNWFARDVSDDNAIAIRALTQVQGGIAASISSTTFMNAQPHIEMVQELLRQNGAPESRWGDALLKAQQWAHGKTNGAGGRWFNDLALTECLLGDPALPMYARGAPVLSGGAPTHSGGGVNGGGAGDVPAGIGGQDGGGGAGVSDAPLTIRHIVGKLNFSAPGHDHVEMSGVLAVPEKNLNGAAVSVDVGGARVDFILAANGSVHTKQGAFRLGGRTREGAQIFRLTLNGGFAALWAGEGLIPKTARAEKTLSVNLLLDGVRYSTAVRVEYSASAQRGRFNR